jgi:2-haloacid dehalogenase
MTRPIQAYVFDAYGTLFDIASPVAAHSRALGTDADTLVSLWRDKQLQYTWLRSLQGHYADFAQVTADALDFSLASLGRRDLALRRQLLEAYERPTAYDDVRPTLEALRRRGQRTAVLSNGTPGWLASALRHNGLEGLFDAVLSVDTLQVYKPHPDVYALAAKELDLPAAAISFQSSNGWDANSAAAFGMRVVWCNRTGQPPEVLPAAPAHTVTSLAGLLELPPFSA